MVGDSSPFNSGSTLGSNSVSRWTVSLSTVSSTTVSVDVRGLSVAGSDGSGSVEMPSSSFSSSSSSFLSASSSFSRTVSWTSDLMMQDDSLSSANNGSLIFISKMATKTQATHPTHLQHKNHSLYNSSVFTIYLILISDSKVNDEVHRICIYYTLFNNLLSSIADLLLTYQVLSRNSKVSLKH